MKKLFTLIAAASLMAACSEDVTTNQTDGDKRYITFSVSDAQNASTRSIVAPWSNEQTEMTDAEKNVVAVETNLPSEYPLCLTITDEPFIHHANADMTRGALFNSGDAANLVFGVTEFLTSDPTTPLFSNSVPAHQSTLDDGRELFKANEFWEYDAYDGINYDFYAYAPQVDGTAHGITLSNEYRTITYDAAGVDVGNQPDLMTARKWTSSYVGAIPLNFQHRLCAIQIKTAGTWTSGYHVSGIKFSNVISSGSFDIDTDKDDAWTSKGAAGDYVVSGFTEAAAINTVIAGPTDTWLMLPPQTLSGAKLSITISNGVDAYSITAPINSSTWRAGHTVTYTVSPEAITTMTVNYPTGSSRSWNDGSNPVTGPVTTYATSDQFGLFVLDKDNKIFVSNQCVTPTAGSDNASRTLDISFFKSKQFRYFLMYPYISDAALETLVGTTNYESYYKLNGTGRPANADAFFAEVITNWNPANNQSTEANFKLQDLQVAKLSGDHFDMVHKMALIEIDMTPKELYDTLYYDGNTYSSGSWTLHSTKNSSSRSKHEWNGSTTFSSTDKAYGNGTACYQIVKPTITTPSFTANIVKANYEYGWSQSCSAISSAGMVEAYTVSCDIEDHFYTAWEFAYTGTYKQWAPPISGASYMFECWGAQGGGGYGQGGYTSGFMNASSTFYIYVGQRGAHGNTTASWNGGGYGYNAYLVSSNGPHYNHGGGATDIRTTSGAWNNAASLNSRIMVAAGGGGGSHGGYGGYGGGLTGTRGLVPSDFGGSNYGGGLTYGYGGSQTAGGSAGSHSYSGAAPTAGGWGYGGSGNTCYGGGGGGGYYGGGGSGVKSLSNGGGGGGSSYISGYSGCTANATYQFTNAVMKGNGVAITGPHGNGEARGHEGDGYARITHNPY